jgi:integrase/recombinase XerD
MATSTLRGGRAPGRALKSPLAVPGASAVSSPDAFGSPTPSPGRAALTDREATLAEFQGYLRTVNNRAGRPFEEKTITAYSDPVKSLDRWMTANG